jgi:nitroreductase
LDFFEVARTQKTMRRLLPDPISDEDLWTVLDTAIRAPSGGNRQGWNFVVVRDAETKGKLGEYYLDAWNRLYGLVPREQATDPRAARNYRSAEHLAHHLADSPVIIIVTLRRDGFAAGPTAGSSIYPAVQNLMLAARALGLGTALTTLHKLHEEDVKQLLGIPDGVETMALIPIGRPKGRFGEPARLPVEKVTYWEKWGERKERA